MLYLLYLSQNKFYEFYCKNKHTPKEALFDPQGNAVKKAMNNLNLSSQKVRIETHNH